MPTVDLSRPRQHYDIDIAPGLLARLGGLIRETAPHERAALIVDERIAQSHGRVAAQSLSRAGYQTRVAQMPCGEAHKTLGTVRSLYEVLLDARLERGSPVVALGGGVTGDTAGFVAATYLRGVPFVPCPTTLLAMVDASVGGKVGVNVPQGKNLIGAFHQPSRVVADVQTLATLPGREVRCGLAECVKHAMIRDADLFAWLEGRVDQLGRGEPATLAELVERNVAIKAAVVMEDEKEAGVRAHLNFGHTFAHAIEARQGMGRGHKTGASGRGPVAGTFSREPSSDPDPAPEADQTYHHGEAVALGMVAAARLAGELGRCDAALSDRLVGLLSALGLPTHAPDLPPTDDLLDAMRLDKKVRGGRVRLILPDRLGAVSIVDDVPDAAISEAWEGLR